MKNLNRTTFSTTLHVIGISLLFLSFCSFGWASTQSSGVNVSVNVSMDYWAPYYRPALAIVPDGVSIHVVNPTSSPHSLTHDGCRADGPCAFDTGAVQPGQEFTIPSLPPGRYSYYCVLHPIMRGEIIVVSRNTVLSQSATHHQWPGSHQQDIQ
ncbi:MAG: cupredoxin domain-containing protein [Nitrospira sp.]|nr:cupredoxin domain-containing protein [Nitrospira sp.]